jgi:hypothetical protein
MSIVDSIYDILPELYINPATKNIYHYTNSNGLLGILNSKKLWLTEFSYMNDPDEIQHGMKKYYERVLVKLIEILESKKYDSNSYEYRILKKMQESYRKRQNKHICPAAELFAKVDARGYHDAKNQGRVGQDRRKVSGEWTNSSAFLSACRRF